jgi:hypothetical protein
VQHASQSGPGSISSSGQAVLGKVLAVHLQQLASHNFREKLEAISGLQGLAGELLEA